MKENHTESTRWGSRRDHYDDDDTNNNNDAVDHGRSRGGRHGRRRSEEEEGEERPVRSTSGDNRHDKDNGGKRSSHKHDRQRSSSEESRGTRPYDPSRRRRSASSRRRDRDDEEGDVQHEDHHHGGRRSRSHSRGSRNGAAGNRYDSEEVALSDDDDDDGSNGLTTRQQAPPPQQRHRRDDDGSRDQRVDDAEEEDDADMDVVDFLTLAGQRYQQRLQLLRQEKIARELASVTGKPTISPFAQEFHENKRRIQQHIGTGHGKSGDQPEPVQERLMRLHARKQQRQAELRERRVQEVTAKEMAGVTHQPHITQKAKDLAMLAKGGAGRGSQADITTKWLEEHRAKLRRLHEEALLREMKEVQPGPLISPYSEELARQAESRSSVPAHAASHTSTSNGNGNGSPHNHSDQQQQHHEQRRDIADQLLAKEKQRQYRLQILAEEHARRTDGPHRPSISQHAQGMHMGPISRLYTAAGNSTHLHQDPMQVSMGEALAAGAGRAAVGRSDGINDSVFHPECTFKPHISAHSRELAAQRSLQRQRSTSSSNRDGGYDSEDTTHRNHSSSPRGRPHHKVNELTPAYKAAYPEHTFRPTISEHSRKLAAEAAARSKTLNSGANMSAAATQPSLHGSPASRLSAPRRTAPTKGSSNASSSVRVSADGSGVDEEDDDNGGEGDEHHPEINEKSRAIAASREARIRASIAGGDTLTAEEVRAVAWQRRHRDTQRRLREEQRARKEAELRECTFTPQRSHRPSSPSAGKKSGGGLDTTGPVTAAMADAFAERNERWQRRREQRLKSMRKDDSAKEIGECTFRPAVHDHIPVPLARALSLTRGSATSTTDLDTTVGAGGDGGGGGAACRAPGVDAFLQRQQSARERKDEAERKLAGFNTSINHQNNARRVNGVTQPVPFRLGKARGANAVMQTDRSLISTPNDHHPQSSSFYDHHPSPQQHASSSARKGSHGHGGHALSPSSKSARLPLRADLYPYGVNTAPAMSKTEWAAIRDQLLDPRGGAGGGGGAADTGAYYSTSAADAAAATFSQYPMHPLNTSGHDIHGMSSIRNRTANTTATTTNTASSVSWASAAGNDGYSKNNVNAAVASGAVQHALFSGPSPVDFVLNNHEKIMHSLRQQQQRK